MAKNHHYSTTANRNSTVQIFGVYTVDRRYASRRRRRRRWSGPTGIRKESYSWTIKMPT